MTIIFFSRLFYPHIGGVEKHVASISKLFALKGNKVIIISESSKVSHSTNYQSNWLSAIPAGIRNNIITYNINPGKENWFKKFRIWKELWKLRIVIKNADIVHCHDVFFWYLPFRFIFPFKKVYTTFHGYEGNYIPNHKSIFMHKLSERLSHGNICIGSFFEKWYGTKPDYISYGAVDFKKIPNSKIKKTGKHSTKNKFIFFGRLEHETGVMKYIEALSILKEKGINPVLDIYGEGNLREALLKYKKDNKLEINLQPFIMNIESVLNNYEYVFCSRYLSMLEAMAFKKQIIAEYNNSIKKDYLELTPFSNYISISKDAKEIAQNTENFILNKKDKKTKEAYEWVRNETWDKMVDIYLKLWATK